MKLYRGQAYGAALGEWWTTERADAESYARSRGGKHWVVVAFEYDGRKLAPFAFFRVRVLHETRARTTYRIPRPTLRRFALGVQIVGGQLDTA